MIELFSGNKLILALANFVAIATAIYVLWSAVQKSWLWLRSVKESRLYEIYRIARRQYMRSAYQKAIDVYLLVSFVGMRLVNIFSGFLLNLFFILSKRERATQGEFDKSLRLKFIWKKFENYESAEFYVQIIFLILSITTLLMFLLMTFDFMMKMVLVQRFRYRWYERRKISWTVVYDKPKAKR